MNFLTLNIPARAAKSIPFLASREKARYEAGLDSFLSFLILELETRAPFETAFSRAAEKTPFPLRGALEPALARFREKGMSMDESLELLTREVDTPLFTRVAGLLRHVYAHGSTRSTIEALRNMLEDVRGAQRTMWKAYAQKLVLFSLVFIGVSALVPALFLAFVTIGSRFLELSLTTWDILFTSLIIFPLVDAGVLGMVWLQMPPHVTRLQGETKKSFSIREFYLQLCQRVEEVCAANNCEGGLPRLVFSSAVEGAGLFIVAWSFFLPAQHVDAFWVSIFLCACAGPLMFNLVWQLVKFEKNTHTIEQQSADSLLVLSSIPSSVSFLDHLRWLARVSPEPIQNEWKKMVSRIEAGKNPALALSELGAGRNSSILESVRALLIKTYESGTAFGEPSRTLAQEISTHHASLHERRAVLLVEKYTILLAGGILVPFLLGILTGVVSSLPLSGEFTSPDAPALFETALLGMRGYLFMYSILAGVFVGFQDGKPAQSIFYVLLLIPCSQLVYTLGAWWLSG